MIKHEEIIIKLVNELEFIRLSNEKILIQTEKSINAVKLSLQKIKLLALKNNFKSEDEEISFFKITKPIIVAKLIYYVKLFNIESKKLEGTKKSQIEYLEDSIFRLQEYFIENKGYYTYYRRGVDMPIDEAAGLGSNFDMLYDIAKANDYQIISLSIQPYKVDMLNQYIYLLHNNLEESDKVNYEPVPIFGDFDNSIN